MKIFRRINTFFVLLILCLSLGLIVGKCLVLGLSPWSCVGVGVVVGLIQWRGQSFGLRVNVGQCFYEAHFA